jgi:L-alanine-DL-glutamate epimerase-like enolase superfamily enzyme
MKITSVQAFLLSYPFEAPIVLPYHGGERTLFKRDAMLIRVETESGLVGYAPGPGTPHAKAAIDQVVAPFLLGHHLADADALRVKFLAGPCVEIPQLARPYCAAEIALYDILGKKQGVPLSELVGGRVRDYIRLYGSAGMYMPPEKMAEEALAISELGFRAYKMQAALGPEKDVEAVRLMREAAGPSFDLMVDAHTWWRGGNHYSYDAVERVAAAMSEYDIAWLEEPVPPEDAEAYRRLKETGHVPLASGQFEPDETRHLNLILTGSIDYVQMDIATQGGYPTARRLLPEIASSGLKFAFHSWGTALEVIAAAHLAICWPDTVVEWLEFPCYSTATRAGMYPYPLAADILKEPLEIDTGDLIVSRRPGLGVEIDESVIERYPFIEGPSSSWDNAGA